MTLRSSLRPRAHGSSARRVAFICTCASKASKGASGRRPQKRLKAEKDASVSQWGSWDVADALLDGILSPLERPGHGMRLQGAQGDSLWVRMPDGSEVYTGRVVVIEDWEADGEGDRAAGEDSRQQSSKGSKGSDGGDRPDAASAPAAAVQQKRATAAKPAKQKPGDRPTQPNKAPGSAEEEVQAATNATQAGSGRAEAPRGKPGSKAAGKGNPKRSTTATHTDAAAGGLAASGAAAAAPVLSGAAAVSTGPQVLSTSPTTGPLAADAEASSASAAAVRRGGQGRRRLFDESTPHDPDAAGAPEAVLGIAASPAAAPAPAQGKARGKGSGEAKAKGAAGQAQAEAASQTDTAAALSPTRGSAAAPAASGSGTADATPTPTAAATDAAKATAAPANTAAATAEVHVFWDLDNKYPVTLDHAAVVRSIKRSLRPYGKVVGIRAYCNYQTLNYVPDIWQAAQERGMTHPLHADVGDGAPGSDGELLRCPMCGAKFGPPSAAAEAKMRKHFEQLHQREHRKRLGSGKGPGAAAHARRYLESDKGARYREAVREALPRKRGFDLEGILKAAGVSLRPVRMGPQAADVALEEEAVQLLKGWQQGQRQAAAEQADKQEQREHVDDAARLEELPEQAPLEQVPQTRQPSQLQPQPPQQLQPPVFCLISDDGGYSPLLQLFRNAGWRTLAVGSRWDGSPQEGPAGGKGAGGLSSHGTSSGHHSAAAAGASALGGAVAGAKQQVGLSWRRVSGLK